MIVIICHPSVHLLIINPLIETEYDDFFTSKKAVKSSKENLPDTYTTTESVEMAYLESVEMAYLASKKIWAAVLKWT